MIPGYITEDVCIKPLRKAVCSKAFSLKKTLFHSLTDQKSSLVVAAEGGCTFSCYPYCTIIIQYVQASAFSTRAVRHVGRIKD